MIRFAICSHDTKKGLKKWEIISKVISEIFKDNVRLFTFKNFYEELVNLNSNDFDIYYANPDDTYNLIKKNFLPFSKFKNDNDKFLLISFKKIELENIKDIYIVPLITSYTAIFELNLENKNIKYSLDYQEVIDKIKNSDGVGIVHEDFFDEFCKENRLNIKVLEKIDIELSHCFCASKDFIEKNKEKIEKFINFLNLEKISNEEIEKFYNILRLSKSFEDSYHLKQTYKALKEINQMTIFSQTEEELFLKICKNLVNIAGFKFVWIGKNIENEIKPVFTYGEDEGYIKDLKIILDNSDLSKGPTAQAYIKNKICINENSLINPAMKPWKEKLIKRKIFSSVSIPLEKKGKVYAVLNLYSQFPYVISDIFISLYKEIKKDLSYSLNKIELIKEYRLLTTALENVKSWVVITDQDGKIFYVNKFVTKLSGYSKKELLGKNPKIFKSGYHNKEFYKKLWEYIKIKKIAFSAQFINKNKNGDIFFIDQTIRPIYIKENKSLVFLAFGEDVTEKTKLFKEKERYRFYDQLTNLLNMYSFSFEVSKLLENDNKISVFILIDIYNMAYLNSIFGLDIGNRLLKEIGERLRNNFKKSDLISRIGGDEFGMFIDNIKNIENISIIIQRIKDIFEKPFFNNINISYNIGISIYPTNGKTFEELYKKAILALNSAKKEGENIVKIFEHKLSKKVYKLFKAEELIKNAFQKNLFQFFFQPYYDSDTLEVFGFESLIRIVDKNRIYLPSDFIDFLENSKYLKEFEEWSIKEIASKIKSLKKPISINISSKGLYSKTLIENLKNLDKDVQDNLTVEITERNILKDIDSAIEILLKIKSINSNINIAIDDFGTGYSSLSYLKDLPVDKLKIDISFIKNMTKSKKDLALVELIVELSKKFGFITIAEGVENEEQVKLLNLLGVDYLQGFFLSKPKPFDEIV